MPAQPLLIALVSVQFFVHALAWAMTARMARRWRATEGHFALFWLFLAAGLALFVPPWASGSAPRNLADLLIIAAAMFEHRGLALHWGRCPRAAGYVAGLAAAAATVAASFLLDNGHGVRVAVVCFGCGAMLAASAGLMWRLGRAATPFFAPVAAAGYALLAALLLARGVQALLVGATTKISIDAPGHANIPLAIAVLFVGGLINLAHIRLVLGRVLHRLGQQAKTDELTGALNRRGLLQELEQAHASALQGRAGYALMMVDVDHFKAINDQHGHAQGDQVLRTVSASLRAALRSVDLVGRWGGEEFCVLLPRTRLADAEHLAQRVAARVAAPGPGVRVTVSIGVSEYGPADADVQAVIRRADDALYAAKDAGRNRVVVAAG
ncbi:GGDEF domain-containing protein [Roseateles sp.]|uniref:GGDEF domain-containing protein n=1 Tax=Roseateles sp. TaxID=1971397 RepID=UPI002DFD84D5|nr:GGDEF domain-containing protein [Roseateles sp.]